MCVRRRGLSLRPAPSFPPSSPSLCNPTLTDQFTLPQTPSSPTSPLPLWVTVSLLSLSCLLKCHGPLQGSFAPSPDFSIHSLPSPAGSCGPQRGARFSLLNKVYGFSHKPQNSIGCSMRAGRRDPMSINPACVITEALNDAGNSIWSSCLLTGWDLCLCIPGSSHRPYHQLLKHRNIRYFLEFGRVHAPERAQLEANLICPEKLITKLKTIVVF